MSDNKREKEHTPETLKQCQKQREIETVYNSTDTAKNELKKAPRASNKTIKKKKHKEKETLSLKEQLFVYKYIETGNATQAAVEAGYSERSAHVIGCRLLKKDKIAAKITTVFKEEQKASIADAQEVMEFFTATMRGEVEDQFGLEAPLSERLRAAQELARRTVDVEQRVVGEKADAVVSIKLDWER